MRITTFLIALIVAQSAPVSAAVSNGTIFNLLPNVAPSQGIVGVAPEQPAIWLYDSSNSVFTEVDLAGKPVHSFGPEVLANLACGTPAKPCTRHFSSTNANFYGPVYAIPTKTGMWMFSYGADWPDHTTQEFPTLTQITFGSNGSAMAQMPFRATDLIQLEDVSGKKETHYFWNADNIAYNPATDLMVATISTASVAPATQLTNTNQYFETVEFSPTGMVTLITDTAINGIFFIPLCGTEQNFWVLLGFSSTSDTTGTGRSLYSTVFAQVLPPTSWGTMDTTTGNPSAINTCSANSLLIASSSSGTMMIRAIADSGTTTTLVQGTFQGMTLSGISAIAARFATDTLFIGKETSGFVNTSAILEVDGNTDSIVATNSDLAATPLNMWSAPAPAITALLLQPNSTAGVSNAIAVMLRPALGLPNNSFSAAVGGRSNMTSVIIPVQDFPASGTSSGDTLTINGEDVPFTVMDGNAQFEVPSSVSAGNTYEAVFAFTGTMAGSAKVRFTLTIKAKSGRSGTRPRSGIRNR